LVIDEPSRPATALSTTFGKNAARAMPICSFAAATRRSAAAMSGCRSSNCEGTPGLEKRLSRNFSMSAYAGVLHVERLRENLELRSNELSIDKSNTERTASQMAVLVTCENIQARASDWCGQNVRTPVSWLTRLISLGTCHSGTQVEPMPRDYRQ
jgi:hypothetical protein